MRGGWSIRHFECHVLVFFPSCTITMIAGLMGFVDRTIDRKTNVEYVIHLLLNVI